MTIRKVLAVGLFMASALLPASAEQQMRFTTSLPPPQYDKPYAGELIIWRVNLPKTLREICHTLNFPKLGGVDMAFACAKAPVSQTPPYPFCHIFIVSDEILYRWRIKLSVLLRHEIGHCNGWPGDHPNSRKVSMHENVDVNVPSGAKRLRAYPPLVCLTPEGKEESCADRRRAAQWEAHYGPRWQPPMQPGEPINDYGWRTWKISLPRRPARNLSIISASSGCSCSWIRGTRATGVPF
jgi:hypothetical protein